MLRIILSDFRGLARSCGPLVAVRWLAMIVLHFPECARKRNLQPADHAMGSGPFRTRFNSGSSAILAGEQVISGIREIWVRDTYLGNGFLSIPDHSTVVDLGSNIGNFTLLALGHGPHIRTVSVEANALLCANLRDSLITNSWTQRAAICTRFIGGRTGIQEKMLADPACVDSLFIVDTDFLFEYGLDRIDFLKCDIEGSEFNLITPESPILAITRQLAIEVHHGAGNPQAFIQMLRDQGFEAIIWKKAPTDWIVLARRPRAADSTLRASQKASIV